jgi:hypothetical protein
MRQAYVIRFAAVRVTAVKNRYGRARDMLDP